MSEVFEIDREGGPRYITLADGPRTISNSSGGTLHFNYEGGYEVEGTIEPGEPQTLSRSVYLHSPDHTTVVITP